jgi:hypothetical protein
MNDREDREAAQALINVLVKTNGFTELPELYLGGETHKLPADFNETMRRLFSELVRRRGVAWLKSAADGQNLIVRLPGYKRSKVEGH